MQFQVQQIGGQWEEFDKSTPLVQLPPAMQFLVGLQFGQINVGTWNPFTLAAKKYFALQTEGGVDKFFWKDGKQPQVLQQQATHEDMLLEAFGDLAIAINTTFTIANNNQDIINLAKQFELGLLAYYAMNMEILSRVDFDGNDRQNCQMQQIFRLEGLEALVPMEIVTKLPPIINKIDHESEYEIPGTHDDYIASHNVPANSKKSVLVSSSATMFTNSVDKAAMFPPQIKVITRYKNVHHARVFGTLLFNVDLRNAERELPAALNIGQKHTQYTNGSVFYEEYQREFLLMPVVVRADIAGILVFAPGLQKGPCVVLARSADNNQESLPGFKAAENKIAKQNITLQRQILKKFCAIEGDTKQICISLIDHFKNIPQDAVDNPV